MASGFIGNEVPRKGLRVRVPCPPLRRFFLRSVCTLDRTCRGFSDAVAASLYTVTERIFDIQPFDEHHAASGQRGCCNQSKHAKHNSHDDLHTHI